VDPEPLATERTKVAGQLVRWNVEAAGQCTLGSFLSPPHVQHDIAGPPAMGEIIPGKAVEAARRAELGDREAGPGDVVEADPGELAAALLELSGTVADENDRYPGRDEPANVGRELITVVDADRTGQVSGGVRGSFADVATVVPSASRARRSPGPTIGTGPARSTLAGPLRLSGPLCT
jgi:hypothetical protein